MRREIRWSGWSEGETFCKTIKLPFLCVWASLVAQLVKNPPAMQETLLQSLGREDPLEMG